tara:strand:+ start:427 stop:2583 length:2157 start_codon:yes stop_codon:yes gene_type:complete
MVKRVVTSIITVAVLMGILVACGGSDSEIAELREELEDVKEQLADKEMQDQEVEIPSSEPLPKPTVPPQPTPSPEPEIPEVAEANTKLTLFDKDYPMTYEGYDHCTDCDNVKFSLIGAEFTGYEGRVTDLNGFLSLEVWVVAENYREPCEVQWWESPWVKRTWGTGLTIPPSDATTLDVAAICKPFVSGPLGYEWKFTDLLGNVTESDEAKFNLGPLNPCTSEYEISGWCSAPTASSLPKVQNISADNKLTDVWHNNEVPGYWTGYPITIKNQVFDNDGIQAVLVHLVATDYPDSEVNGCKLTWITNPADTYKNAEGQFSARCIPLEPGPNCPRILVQDKKGNISENWYFGRSSGSWEEDCEKLYSNRPPIYQCPQEKANEGTCLINPEPTASFEEITSEFVWMKSKDHEAPLPTDQPTITPTQPAGNQAPPNSQPPVLGDNPIFNCTHYQNDGVTHNIGQHQSWEDIKFFIRCSVSPPFVTYDFSNTNVSDLQYKVYINEVLHKEWGLADVTIEGPYLLNNDSSRIGFTVETPFLLSGTQLNSGDEVSWDFLGSVTRSRMISSGLDGNQGSYTIPGGNSPAPTPTPGQPQPTPTPVPQPTPTPVPQPTPTPDSGGGGGGYTGGYWSGCYFNGIPMWGSVYVTPYQSFADVSVYVTGFSSFADLNVYVTEFASFATSCGQWHQTDFASFADFSVYFTSFQSFADFSIYYTDFASFAGR